MRSQIDRLSIIVQKHRETYSYQVEADVTRDAPSNAGRYTHTVRFAGEAFVGAPECVARIAEDLGVIAKREGGENGTA